jgi:hypothetical protein
MKKQKLKQKFPHGWDEKKVREVIAYYEAQTEDEEAEEIEAALKQEGITMVAVPNPLVDKVRALIARQQGA